MNENLKLKSLGDYKDTFIYKTEAGDTLGKIAEKFNTTESAIISENALTSEPERGQYLIISKIAGVRYVVRPKDDLLSLAGGDRDKMLEIMRKNKTDEIYVGQIIYL